jgi:hypothetical protein
MYMRIVTKILLSMVILHYTVSRLDNDFISDNSMLAIGVCCQLKNKKISSQQKIIVADNAPFHFHFI